MPLWQTIVGASLIVAIVLGREVFMTVFREYAKRRGVVIAAIGPAWAARLLAFAAVPLAAMACETSGMSFVRSAGSATLRRSFVAASGVPEVSVAASASTARASPLTASAPCGSRSAPSTSL